MWRRTRGRWRRRGALGERLVCFFLPRAGTRKKLTTFLKTKTLKKNRMVAVAAPPRAGRALGEYPMAQAVCDGFGAGGGVTWRRVAALLEKNVEEVEAAAREAERREKL